MTNSVVFQGYPNIPVTPVDVPHHI